MKYLKQLINNRKLRKEFIYYVIVGLAGTVVDFTVFYFALWLEAPQLLAQWLASLSGFTHNHLWQHYKVFEHNQRFRKTTTLSLIVSVISVVISGPLLILFNKFIPYVWFNKILLIGIATIALFIVRKKWIFVKKSSIVNIRIDTN